MMGAPANPLKRIILVGGCSRSAFLLHYLKDHYERNQAANYCITVEAPEAETYAIWKSWIFVGG